MADAQVAALCAYAWTGLTAVRAAPKGLIGAVRGHAAAGLPWARTRLPTGVACSSYSVPVSLSPADLLLASPLGRQLLASYVGWGPGGSLEDALFKRLGLGPVPGRSALRAAGARTQRWQDVPASLAGKVVGAAVEWRSWREQLADIGESGLLADLAGVSSLFGFGGGDEELWGLTALAARELRPVAEALVASPGARCWWGPVDLADQRFVEWDDQPRLAGPALGQAVRECMASERAENTEGLLRPRPRERPGVRVGAYWWSPPGFAPQAWTTTAVEGLPAAGLCEFFDTYLPPQDVTGAVVWALQIDPRARVLEITGPADWQGLVARFPRDVTGTHDGEWRYWGGVPGPWRLPDWEQVMDHYDGVHVSTGAAVASCGVASSVADGFTMLAAWTPGATLWLRDMVIATHRLGRWNGGPQSGTWDDYPPEWTPEEDDPAH